MVFSDVVNKNGCAQLIERLCKTGDGGITGNTTLFKQVASDYDQGVKNTITELMDADVNWKVDDTSYADFATAKATLETGVRDYILPGATSGADFSGFYRLNHVRVLDAQGKKHKVEPLPADEDINDEEHNQTGLPTHYKLIGRSILFYPTPVTGSVTLVDGAEVDFQRANDPFDSTDTARCAPFPDAFHDVPCLYASWVYLLPYQPDLAQVYYQTYLARIEKLKSFKTMDDDNTPTRITPAVHSNK
jgi:hypothetical protein